MWKIFAVILPALVCSTAFLIRSEDENLITSYNRARSRLTPEQEEFLSELLAADDAIIADMLKGRGIVDDVLQALSGVGGGNIRVNIVGGGNPQPSQPGQVINPTFTLTTSNQQPQQAAAVAAPANLERQFFNTNATGAPIPGFPVGNAPAQQQNPGQGGNLTTVGGNNNHLFNTITSVIRNSNSRNVTGIVDQSLRIATPAPIREFVTGILGVVYCNGIRRLLGRC